MTYYLIDKKLLMRGDPNNVATYESFVDGEWREASYLGWQMLYGDLIKDIDYQEITQDEAQKLINQA